MKPAPFDYAKPATLEEAFGLLEGHGDDAQVLAGGQSLLPTLNMRLSAPAILVDISALDALRGISLDNEMLRIGALTSHSELQASEDVARAAPLLALAVSHIAHPAIRNRGTFGGSLAHADPAAEFPACVVALDAGLEIAGRSGTRKVAAVDFFHGLYETGLGPGEILTAAEVPVLQKGFRSGFSEFARRTGDFAISALAAHAQFDGDTVRELRLVFAGVDIRPLRATAAEKIVTGNAIAPELLAEARARLGDDLRPTGDLHASAAMKLHLSGVLLERVLSEMAGAG
ncbi:MAG: xanthine dehydrogenase family protein subunit M [Alphaproteobacteria bacterium]|nr:xanthine dehydrogenase family protein subunit M [Alphaproteobacteria bacterium]